MRGPKPDPDDVRILKGSTSPVAGSTVADVPPCPWTLDDVATTEYYRQGELLARRGRLTETDAPDLALYALVYSRLVKARKLLDTEGMTTVGGSGGTKTHPAVAVEKSCVDQLHKILSAFGCNPTDRARLGISERTRVGNPLDALRAKMGKKKA